MNETRPPDTMAQRGRRLLELDAATCRELLSRHHVGCVVLNDASGPLALPVNYAIEGNAVVFATSPHNTVARHARNHQVSFLVCDFDEVAHCGWSVLVRGTARFVEVGLDAPGPGEGSRPDPWPEGLRALLVRIPIKSVSGRRLLCA